MITKNELLEYAKAFGLPAYQAEKEYFQHLLLFLIFANTSSIVFKGGTAIKKAYGLPRFSEDLDFTEVEETNFDELFEAISKTLREKFGVENELKKIEGVGKTYRFKIIGPLVTTLEHREACFVYVEISAREVPKTRAIVKIEPEYRDLPAYTIIVMSKEEILAEKVRAILSREKARDVFDLWYLLKTGTEIRMDWIKEKLAYYKTEFTNEKFFEQLEKHRKTWRKELKHLVQSPPEFEEAIELVKNKFETRQTR